MHLLKDRNRGACHTAPAMLILLHATMLVLQKESKEYAVMRNEYGLGEPVFILGNKNGFVQDSRVSDIYIAGKTGCF